MDSKRPAPTDPFCISLTGGIVFRAEAMVLREFLRKLQDDATRSGVGVVYVKVSGGKLWIKEGEAP